MRHTYEMHIIFWGSEIQTGYLIPTRCPDLVVVRKRKNCPSPKFSIDHCVKIKEGEKRDKYLDLA